jgi:hypothetical protein
MKRVAALLASGAALLLTAACADGYYGYGYGYGYGGPRYYSSYYYDGYYGPIRRGYWVGRTFYYSRDGRRYYRGHDSHFRRYPATGYSRYRVYGGRGRGTVVRTPAFRPRGYVGRPAVRPRGYVGRPGMRGPRR